MKLSGLHICQLWWEHRCQPTLSHTLFHTSDGWQIFTTGFLLHLTHRSHSETKTDSRWDGKRKQREREKKTCALCLCVCSAEDTLKEEGEHRGFTSQNSHLVCLFVFHSSVAKHQSLHHIPVWLSTPLIKHLPVIPLLHRPSLPLPLTDCRGRPHTNSSLKCPPEGPALYSWKVRSALQEKALQNE